MTGNVSPGLNYHSRAMRARIAYADRAYSGASGTLAPDLWIQGVFVLV